MSKLIRVGHRWLVKDLSSLTTEEANALKSSADKTDLTPDAVDAIVKKVFSAVTPEQSQQADALVALHLPEDAVLVSAKFNLADNTGVLLCKKNGQPLAIQIQP